MGYPSLGGIESVGEVGLSSARAVKVTDVIGLKWFRSVIECWSLIYDIVKTVRGDFVSWSHLISKV